MELIETRKKYKITEEELKNHTFFHKGEDNFYLFIEREIKGYNSSEEDSLDCRKIEIAKNIQDYWWNYAENDLNAKSWEVGMALAMSGPKVNEDLDDYEFVIYDGFFANEK